MAITRSAHPLDLDRFQVAEQRERARGAGTGATVATFVYPTITLALLILGWEVACNLFRVPTYFLPAPSLIMGDLVARHDLYLQHGLITLLEVVAGFLLSVLFGVPLAVAIAYSRLVDRTVYPLLVSSQTVPKVAIAPLFLVWFGFGWTPKLLVALLIAFFPIVIDTVVGLKQTTPEMFYLARSMGASPWQTFFKVRLPNALPSMFGGLKVAITFAVIGATVAEFVGAEMGLGYLIQSSIANLNAKQLFASIVGLSVLGIVLFFAVEVLERLMLPWHTSRRLEDL